jgi:hypothetical protein
VHRLIPDIHFDIIWGQGRDGRQAEGTIIVFCGMNFNALSPPAIDRTRVSSGVKSGVIKRIFFIYSSLACSEKLCI